MSSTIIEVSTQAYDDQLPGTSGLRKRVQVFQQPNYTENFIQAILDSNSKPQLLVIGGDGRYYSGEAIKKIINVCAANGVLRLIVGKDGLLSTPAASALIRSAKANGGILLTASHNPGGRNGDFGIKYNIDNGGPAPEKVTNKIYEAAKSITSYKSLLKIPQVDLSQIGSFEVGGMKVDIVDPVENYLEMARQVFDFDKIKEMIREQKPRMVVDCMSGVMGPYARKVLVETLGAPESCLMNATPLENFDGKHPDPNPVYACDLVNKLKKQADDTLEDPSVVIGVAFDGDGDRAMILGRKAFFVSPCDSLAIIAANIKSIKYFQENECRGFARSLPTSPAIDRVAKKANLKCYETPTGWKYFGSLMDHNLISLCGEESFGTGSEHIREKDGLWTCLAWLSILADTKKSVEQVVKDHWAEYGRDYYLRYDFEDCDAKKVQVMIRELEVVLKAPLLIGKYFGTKNQYVVKETGNFKYADPVSKSVTPNHGFYVRFLEEARMVLRLSGTSGSGVTVRLYLCDYLKDQQTEDAQMHLQDLLAAAFSITKLPEILGTNRPTLVV